MATIASKCPDITVTIVDLSEERIKAWNSDDLPIYEPGLAEIVKECRGRNLFFSTDVKGAIEEADIIFASVNTPTKITGVGAGRAADLRYIESVGRTVAQYANRPKIIIEKSTVPVKTAEALQRVVSANQGSQKFWILSNPEFLAEGTAMKDLSAPDRVLIGGPTSVDGVAAANVLVDIYANWVPREKILTLADPGEGIAADKGLVVRNLLAKLGVAPGGAIFADDSQGNLLEDMVLGNVLPVPRLPIVIETLYSF